MIIGVPLETRPGERRVAATPETVKKLREKGHTLRIETGAGLGSSIRDRDFLAAGAEIVPGDQAWAAELVLKVQRPRALDDTRHEVDRLVEGAILVSMLYPHEDPDTVARLAARKVTALGLEAVPRITRAQKMDVLSSMANLAGYRAVLEAAAVFGRFMPLLMTAAGSVPPAQVLVVGAGVAGLSAAATAKRLGAVVKAFDLRPASRDQVKSVGAEFLTLDLGFDGTGAGGYAKAAPEEVLRKEQELLATAAASADIVITTALIPGRPAPLLITRAAVEGMKPGSVVVDLAIEQGGNVEVARLGEKVEHEGVIVLGYTNLPSRMPIDASRLYARNLLQVVLHLHGKQGFGIDLNDEITGACTLVHQGEIRKGAS